MLEDEEWREWSDAIIAEKCFVSVTLVYTIRSENPTYFSNTLTAKGADGKTRKKKQNKKPKQETEQEIRGQRICGKYIQEGQERGEIRDKGNDKGNNNIGNIKNANITNSTAKTLSEIGLTPYESMIFQQIASIPEEEFGLRYLPRARRG